MVAEKDYYSEEDKTKSKMQTTMKIFLLEDYVIAGRELKQLKEYSWFMLVSVNGLRSGLVRFRD